MKNVLLIFLNLYIGNILFAGNLDDRLVYKNDTLNITISPLEQYLLTNNISIEKLFDSDTNCDFNKNYIVTWIIINDSLYLNKIENPCFTNDFYFYDSIYITNRFANLDLFKDNVNKSLFSNWFSGTIYINIGKSLLTYCDDYNEIYESELKFEFTNGILQSVTELDNTKTNKSKYSNSDTLKYFLDEKLKDSIFDFDKEYPVRVLVGIKSVTDNGIIDSLEIFRSGGDKFYDNKAIELLRLIPNWDVKIYHGEQCHDFVVVPVIFN